MTLAMLELKGPFNLENLDIRNEEAVSLITLHVWLHHKDIVHFINKKRRH